MTFTLGEKWIGMLSSYMEVVVFNNMVYFSLHHFLKVALLM